MTEREKLQAILDVFDVEVMEARGSITAGGRCFFFDESGMLTKVLYGSGKDRVVVRAGDAERAREAGAGR
jgi:hypothetical protein